MIKTIRYSRLKALIFWFHCSFKLPLYQGLCVSFGGLVVSLGASSLGIPLWILTRFALSRPHLPREETVDHRVENSNLRKKGKQLPRAILLKMIPSLKLPSQSISRKISKNRSVSNVKMKSVTKPPSQSVTN